MSHPSHIEILPYKNGFVARRQFASPWFWHPTLHGWVSAKASNFNMDDHICTQEQVTKLSVKARAEGLSVSLL
jgi:hypothetical protein